MTSRPSRRTRSRSSRSRGRSLTHSACSTAKAAMLATFERFAPGMHGLEHHVPPERITHNHTSSCVRLRIRPCLTLRIGWQRSTVMHTQNDAFVILFASFVMLYRSVPSSDRSTFTRQKSSSNDGSTKSKRKSPPVVCLAVFVRACVCLCAHAGREVKFCRSFSCVSTW